MVVWVSEKQLQFPALRSIIMKGMVITQVICLTHMNMSSLGKQNKMHRSHAPKPQS